MSIQDQLEYFISRGVYVQVSPEIIPNNPIIPVIDIDWEEHNKNVIQKESNAPTPPKKEDKKAAPTEPDEPGEPGPSASHSDIAIWLCCLLVS